MKPIALAIHGGAGTLKRGVLSEGEEREYFRTLELARDTGYNILLKGGTSLDAVEASVCILEDSPLFNAGKGSVFTSDGRHEMDASIMEGRGLNAGAVALVTGIKNPISLAREVMEHSGHVFLAGDGAMAFAKERKTQIESHEYFHNELRHKQWQDLKNSDNFQLDHSDNPEGKFGTVGAVALDQHGDVAAATSTGGMTNKKYGRVGDSPMIGAGTYANNKTCAVSCTGSGEFFIRAVVAYDVSALMEFGGQSLEEAASIVVQERLLEINGDGGLISVDAKGNIALPFNTDGMYRAGRTSGGEKFVGIYEVNEPG